MNKVIEGQVDIKKDYFILTYGSARVDKPTFIEVALVGKINDQEFVYQFLDQATDEIKKSVLNSIQFLLIEHGPISVVEDAWKYAQYHTTTGSNLYSDVHWNFYPVGTTIK